MDIGDRLKAFWEKYATECITILAMLVIGTCMHFVLDVFDSPAAVNALGWLFPVNESLWEHMKLLWYPFLGAGVVLSVKMKDAGYFGGFVIGGVVAVLAMIGAFAFYQSIANQSILALDLSLYVLVTVLTALLAFALSRRAWCRRALPLWIICAVLMTYAVIYLTYRPGTGYLFFDGHAEPNDELSLIPLFVGWCT